MARIGDVRMLIGQQQQQWEYRSIPVTLDDPDDIYRWLNAMGGDGWQLVTVTGNLWVFIRPVMSEQKD